MLRLAFEGIARSILAVSFFLLLQYTGVTSRSDQMKAIAITTVFTHVMIEMMKPNLNWISNLYDKNK